MDTFVTTIDPQVILILLAAGFVAAFIDSVVGGGGLISLPTFLLVGLPPHLALGTNKLAGTVCSLTSFLSFLRSGKIRLDIIKYLFWLSLAGSVAGAYIVQQIPPVFLRPLVISLLVLVAFYTFLRKNWGTNSRYTGLSAGMAVLAGLMAVALGFYDGFFGPGAGSFLLFGFLFFGFDFVEASGNAKALNFASNIGSLATFVLLGAVQYVYGLTMGIGMMIGACIGSQVAIRKGSTYVRPLFLGVTVAMISKQIWDLLQ
ncbi:TSUP family transporter [Acetonema longum]|uniref:Probable membrane transporter protein n=1 Tax=Acetonema longum DSM 6540 TaxID=1009370 RepID=F7NEZ1_9FIRM|nr:TSUP family transporter [Acetonema longum]EGO65552.1 hypothetical protein ALO_03041 [Acetonema longum DSM 6540]